MISFAFASRYRIRGTRFRIYPQLKGLRGVAAPELVYVDAAPGTIGPGPSDDRMYVVDAEDKIAYDDSGDQPPYRGSRLPPAAPNQFGHFDDIRPGTRAFSAASAFAIARCVLDLWEDYFGRQLAWYFRGQFPRLEIIPRVGLQNAVSRPGYLELGHADARATRWFADSFDSVAHEMGHAIVRSAVGQATGRRSLTYRALEESCADLVAIVSALHFESVMIEVLRETKGRLFATSLLSRIAEFDRRRYVRSALNRMTLPEAKRARDPHDPVGYKYLLARPFTGAAFDVLVEIYEERLVERGGITARVAASSSGARVRNLRALRREFTRRFRARPAVFREALVAAREDFGRLIAAMLDGLSPRGLTYGRAVARMVEADRRLNGGRHRALIDMAFLRRGIRRTGR